MIALDGLVERLDESHVIAIIAQTRNKYSNARAYMNDLN